MRRFYALVRLTYGEPANPAKAAELEVGWWRVHREGQHRDGPHAAEDAEPADELVASLTRLYSYLYGEPEDTLRPAAVHRARAMDLSDRWIGKAASQTAACCPWSTRPWSVPTPPCSPPSITKASVPGDRSAIEVI